jgi:hypothetical protein
MEPTVRHNMKNDNLGGAIRAAHFLSFLRHQKEKIYLHPFSQNAETNSNVLQSVSKFKQGKSKVH